MTSETGQSGRGHGALTGPLRSRLIRNPGDEQARRQLVDLYRELGHPDQAGRYAVAIDGLATRDELRAYGALLRGLQADEARMRTLSRLPKGVDIPPEVQDILAAKAELEPGAVLGTLLGWLWALTAAAVFVGPLAVSVSALLRLSDSHAVAVFAAFIALGAGFAASLCTSAWFAIRHAAKPALAWFLGSGVLVALGVLLSR